MRRWDTARHRGLGKGEVRRDELPTIGARNSVPRGALDGGVSRNLRLDQSGEAPSSALLSLEPAVPDERPRRPGSGRRGTSWSEPSLMASTPPRRVARPTVREGRRHPERTRGEGAPNQLGGPVGLLDPRRIGRPERARAPRGSRPRNSSAHRGGQTRRRHSRKRSRSSRLSRTLPRLPSLAAGMTPWRTRVGSVPTSGRAFGPAPWRADLVAEGEELGVPGQTAAAAELGRMRERPGEGVQGGQRLRAGHRRGAVADERAVGTEHGRGGVQQGGA